MATRNRRAGCGCCGFLFSFLLFLVVLLLVGVGLFYFQASNQLNRLASTAPVPLPPAGSSRQLYNETRQKFAHFLADSAERSLTLSNAELNALLADSPDLRILHRGTVVILNQNSADVYCSVPVSLPFLSRRYLNYTFHVRPSVRDEDFELNVFRIDREGTTLGPTELRKFQNVAVASAEKILSVWNKMQMDRSVHDVRIENGNLILAR
jgi:hypothetical protein